MQTGNYRGFIHYHAHSRTPHDCLWSTRLCTGPGFERRGKEALIHPPWAHLNRTQSPADAHGATACGIKAEAAEGGHLRSFQIVANVNKAAINVNVQGFAWTQLSAPLGKYRGA